MRGKKRGFTVLELIITISITVIILGVIYTFFYSNSKTLATVEINSDLQIESELIQKELLTYGMQADKIIKINDIEIRENNKYGYDKIINTNGKVDVNELILNVENKHYIFSYKKDEKKLSLKKPGEDEKDLSSNVTEFKIRPIDYRMNINGNFHETTGVEISLILNKKKGYSDVSIPVSVIVKFRNKV